MVSNRVSESEFESYRSIQTVAKSTLVELQKTIRVGETERTIARRAVELLKHAGIEETWYYACPAFVLAGERSTLSISGRDYRPADVRPREVDLVSIDLSPCRGSIWGDCARTYCLEAGKYVADPASPEFRQGLEVESLLHKQLKEIASPEMTFSELFLRMNRVIADLGFENLDAFSNLGHSLERNLADRKYIDEQNHLALGSVGFFTFEPHLRAVGSLWGFKHENVYFFDVEGVLQEL
ncbi:MAG: aminopeptidase P family protein [Planctomycetaceae bacterium]|nr:aminopeptidase P family protein [Planctomycetaceae bacterium]